MNNVKNSYRFISFQFTIKIFRIQNNLLPHHQNQSTLLLGSVFSLQDILRLLFQQTVKHPEYSLPCQLLLFLFLLFLVLLFHFLLFLFLLFHFPLFLCLIFPFILFLVPIKLAIVDNLVPSYYLFMIIRVAIMTFLSNPSLVSHSKVSPRVEPFPPKAMLGLPPIQVYTHDLLVSSKTGKCHIRTITAWLGTGNSQYAVKYSVREEFLGILRYNSSTTLLDFVSNFRQLHHLFLRMSLLNT